MSDFVRFVFHRLTDSLVLVVPAGIVFLLAMCAVWLLHRRKYQGEKKFPLGRWLAAGLLLGYLAVILFAVLHRDGSYGREWNFRLFRGFRECWNSWSEQNWLNLLLNIAMFCPLGFLLPLLHPFFRKWWTVLLAGFGLSLALESVQLVCRLGLWDVDDLLHNTLGCGLGYSAAMALLMLFQKRRRSLPKLAGYLALPCLCALFFGGVLLVYQLQPYGNLPDAPAYRVDTRDIRWELNCPLSGDPQTAWVCKTEASGKAACDAFADDFLRALEDPAQPLYYDTFYYDTFAYYQVWTDKSPDFPATSLIVYYADCTYDVHLDYWGDAPRGEADRKTIEALLAELGISVPSQAVFACGGNGVHSFAMEADPTSGYGGILHCAYGEDGRLYEVENHLVRTVPVREEPILSPAEAYQQLLAGKFQEAQIGSRHPEIIEVTACDLVYETDTKGYYRPVYEFSLVCDGTPGNSVRIPADR